jgi:hypothetical protein
MLNFFNDISALVFAVSFGFYLYHISIKPKNKSKSKIYGLLSCLSILSMVTISIIRNNVTIPFVHFIKISTNTDTVKAITKIDTVYKYIPDKSSIKIDKLLEQQKQLSKIATRPYISLSEIGPFIITPYEKLKFGFKFHNSGSTPANDVNFKTLFKIGTGVYQSDLDTLRNTKILTYGGIIGADQSQWFTFNKTIIITKDDSAAVFNGDKFIYSIGKVLYVDNFKESHIMCYCIRFQPPDNWEYIYEDPDCNDESKMKNRKLE